MGSRRRHSPWLPPPEVTRGRTARMCRRRRNGITSWRGLAEIAEKYIHKGDKVTILGTINYREYEKDGIKRYVTDILAYDIMLCGKSDSAGSRPQVTANDVPSQSDFPPMAQPIDDLPF